MKKYFYFLIIFIILAHNNLFTQVGGLENLEYNYKQFNSIIFIHLGYPFIAESQEFFEYYMSVLGGVKEEFKFYPIGGIGTKFQFWNHSRVGIEAELFFVQLNDSYIQEVVNIDEKIIYSITQDVKVTSIPAFITYDFIPNNQQFRTYAGGGLGAVFSTIVWNENLSSTDPYDKRKGGEHVNETNIYPAACIYTGLELGFDKNKTKNFVGSFTIDIKYTYMFREEALFSVIAEQHNKKPEKINEIFTILPGYLGLYIGLTFDFNRVRK